MHNSKLFRISLLIVFFVSACAREPVQPSPLVQNSDMPIVQPPIPSATPFTGPRSVVSTTLSLIEQWRFRTDKPNNQYPVPSTLFIANDKVIFGSYAGPQSSIPDSLLTALTLDGGQIVWQTRYGPLNMTTRIDDALLLPEHNRLYLVSPTFRVSAFNLETGEQLWVSEKLKGHELYRFVPDLSGDKIVLSSSGDDIIILDVDSGAFLSYGPRNMPWPIATYGQIVVSLDGNQLVGTDYSTKQVLWEYYHEWQRIVPYSGGILLQSTRPPIYSYDYIDVSSGKKIWSTSIGGRGYASNISVLGDQAYTLDREGNLVAMALNDGHVLGEMRFDYAPTLKPAIYPYWVAASGPYLLIYFGDSQELIAFK